jgi:hypothetical protein
MPMTRKDLAAAFEERASLTRRIARLDHFIESEAKCSPECADILREGRDLLAQELLHLELTLSLETHGTPPPPAGADRGPSPSIRFPDLKVIRCQP